MSEIRQMWVNGPLRQWEASRTHSNWMPYADGGFVGPYVCAKCKADTVGLYRNNAQNHTRSSVENWICAGCKEAQTIRKPQPESLRRK